MNRQRAVEERERRPAGEDTRELLLSGLSVTERRLQLAGVSTAVRWKAVTAHGRSRSRAAASRNGHLHRIAVPTTLIWGRHNLGVRLNVAEAVSAQEDMTAQELSETFDTARSTRPNAAGSRSPEP